MLHQVSFSKTVAISCRDCKLYEIQTQDAIDANLTPAIERLEKVTLEHLSSFPDHKVLCTTISTEEVVDHEFHHKQR